MTVALGVMGLPAPGAGDSLSLYATGVQRDGGLWTALRRLADHDHSGGEMGPPVAGGGGGTGVEVTITGTEGVTVVESPANTFALGLTASAGANNIIEIRADGIYAAAGAIPPEYVTDSELATALGPYATDADLAAHAAAANPHPVYATDADLTGYAPVGHTHPPTDVTITPDGSLTATESPANTFALAVKLSPDAGNALTLRGNGLYGTDTTGAGGDFVETVGDTMTGTLVFDGGASAVAAGGAVRVTGAPAAATTGQIFGPSSPAFGTLATTGGWRVGFVFTPTAVGMTVTDLRWYRTAAGDPTPTTVELWDNVTSAVVWTTTSLAAFADTAVGWKTVTVPLASRPAALVSGRAYTLIWHRGSSQSLMRASSYAPVATGAVTLGNRINSPVGTGLPTTTTTSYFMLDVVLGAGLLPGPTAQSGAVRLPTAALGAVVWRNAGDTADLPLTVNASNALTFNGLVVLTQAALDALTTRVATLEGQMAAHQHATGTIAQIAATPVMP